MKDKYLEIATNLELENAELKRKYQQLDSVFKKRIIFLILFIMVIGTIFLMIKYNVGFNDGIKQSQENCMVFFCERGHCQDWAEISESIKVCDNLMKGGKK